MPPPWPLLAAAVLLAVLSIVALARALPNADAGAPRTPRHPSTGHLLVSAAPTSPTSEAQASSAVGPPDLLAGPVSDALLNQSLRAELPSYLLPDIERPLLHLAVSAAIADLSGIGREQFPKYLPGPVPAELYRNVRVQPAVARQRTDGSVEAHLLWAAVPPRGQPVERRTDVVRLRYVEGTWTSVAG